MDFDCCWIIFLPVKLREGSLCMRVNNSELDDTHRFKKIAFVWRIRDAVNEGFNFILLINAPVKKLTLDLLYRIQC